MSPGCRSQLAVQFTWPSAWPSGRERSVCPSTLPQLSVGRGARRFLRTALPSHSSSHPGQSSREWSTRQGREKARSVCLANFPEVQHYCMDAHARASCMFQKTRCFSSSFFHSLLLLVFIRTGTPEHLSHAGMQPRLLTPHQNSSCFTPSTAILFGFFSMFLFLTILEQMTTSLDFSGSFPLMLSFQSCFYKAKHPVFCSRKSSQRWDSLSVCLPWAQPQQSEERAKSLPTILLTPPLLGFLRNQGYPTAPSSCSLVPN